MSSRFTAPYRRLFLSVVVALAITACQKKTEPAADAPAAAAGPTAETLEGQVDIVAWPGYVERGDTDKNYDWVTAFEQETACKVNVKTAGTSDEMVSLMTQGGYDLVTASGDASIRLIRGGTVQPVDISRIPSYANVDDRLKEAPWHFVDGKHYGTPYQWGPNVLMYNTTVFKTAPTSWSVVLEPQKLPDGKPNKGRIQAYDGPIYIADAALYLMAKRPELGIKNPYELNEEQYAAALEVLRKQHPLRASLLARRQRPGAGLHQRRRRRLGLLAVPGQHAGGQQAADRKHGSGRRRHRMGGHDHARHGCQAPELRIPVDGVVAQRQGAGRSRGLVRLGARGAGGLRGQRAARTGGLQDQRLRELRPHLVLAHAGSDLRAGHLRAVQPLGDRLRRGDGRPLEAPERGRSRFRLAARLSCDGSTEKGASPPRSNCARRRRAFGPVVALDRVSLTIAPGEFFALLGPSGSGKTTCLRLIAGFDHPDSGQVLLDGVDVTDVPPFERNVNTVFQDYALFPHMNVADNVAYGLRVRGVAAAERRKRALEMLDLVQLESFADRRPTQLSGGQKQRVALARALINQPKVLLLDEPLGALDLKLREEMQTELKSLQQRLGITFVFVTHDQGEALIMANRVAVFNAGRIEQLDTPRALYTRPKTAFVAGFVGSANVVESDLAERLTGRAAGFRDPARADPDPDGRRAARGSRDRGGRARGHPLSRREQPLSRAHRRRRRARGRAGGIGRRSGAAGARHARADRVAQGERRAARVTMLARSVSRFLHGRQRLLPRAAARAAAAVAGHRLPRARSSRCSRRASTRSTSSRRGSCRSSRSRPIGSSSGIRPTSTSSCARSRWRSPSRSPPP